MRPLGGFEARRSHRRPRPLPDGPIGEPRPSDEERLGQALGEGLMVMGLDEINTITHRFRLFGVDVEQEGEVRYADSPRLVLGRKLSAAARQTFANDSSIYTYNFDPNPHVLPLHGLVAVTAGLGGWRNLSRSVPLTLQQAILEILPSIENLDKYEGG